MVVLRGFKTELDLNNVQKTACIQHAGAARWAFNWGLERKIEAYQKGEKVPTAIDLHRELNVLKQGELAWMYEVSKCAPQEALRVANIRKNALHQATSLLTRTKAVIVLEDLKVSGMMKNRHLAQAIADVGFYEFRRQMKYKGLWFGCKVILANPFYPSTKRCSRCGHIQEEMDLSIRVYTCDYCGLTIDRDLNAALNLERLTTGSSPERYACGESVRPGFQAVLVEAGTDHPSASG
jgi:IS605 OrfB family transposase